METMWHKKFIFMPRKSGMVEYSSISIRPIMKEVCVLITDWNMCMDKSISLPNLHRKDIYIMKDTILKTDGYDEVIVEN